MKKVHTLSIILWVCIPISHAQDHQKEYHWKPPIQLRIQFGLPDPFLKPDGTRIQSKQEWPRQRDYIIAMLEHYQYGSMPPVPENMVVKETLSEDLFDDSATRKLYTSTLTRNGKTLDFHFGLIKPRGNGPFPVIIKNDRDVPDPLGHEKNRLNTGRLGIPEGALNEALKRGYIYCAYNREDLSSDYGRNLEKNRNSGVFPLYPEYDWGTIAAWAWGYKLIIDYFEKLDFVDIKKITVTGHSRGGKTAFCGGIFEDRIAVTAPNSSGLGGTSSHLFYELIPYPPQVISDHIIYNPHWWAAEYYECAGFESRTPFDAHFGKIAIAPRGFFNTHAYQDYHANPFGAWLTSEAAKIVYQWLDVEQNIAMHLRAGGHAQNTIDWVALLDFCDMYFYGKSKRQYGDYKFSSTNPYPWARIPVNWEAP